MYQKILNEAMEELRESEFKELYADRNTDSMTHFVKDCVLETDLEVRIPDDYVNNVAERLSLYQEMDNLENEEELTKFSEGLIDRFGPLPKEVKELILSFKLRWLAQDLGLEKLVLKGGKMIGYFISNPQSVFYETPVFTSVLNYIQKNPKNCSFSEANDRLRIIYTDITNLKKGFERLHEIQELVEEISL